MPSSCHLTRLTNFAKPPPALRTVALIDERHTPRLFALYSPLRFTGRRKNDGCAVIFVSSLVDLQRWHTTNYSYGYRDTGTLVCMNHYLRYASCTSTYTCKLIKVWLWDWLWKSAVKKDASTLYTNTTEGGYTVITI